MRYYRDTEVKTFGRLNNEFLPTRRNIPQEKGVRRVHRVATSLQGAARGVGRTLLACRLLVHASTALNFPKFLNIPKLVKIAIENVLESVFLP